MKGVYPHAVAKAAARHATLRSTLTKGERKVSGLTRIPFGKKIIGDGVARFYADAERMHPVAKAGLKTLYDCFVDQSSSMLSASESMSMSNTTDHTHPLYPLANASHKR